MAGPIVRAPNASCTSLSFEDWVRIHYSAQMEEEGSPGNREHGGKWRGCGQVERPLPGPRAARKRMSVLVGNWLLHKKPHLLLPSFYNFLSPPGSASPKPDEASTAVFSCSVLGDVPCHHPLHLHGIVWLHEVRVENPGQHHSQLAQLLVCPCHLWVLATECGISLG